MHKSEKKQTPTSHASTATELSQSLKICVLLPLYTYSLNQKVPTSTFSPYGLVYNFQNEPFIPFYTFPKQTITITLSVAEVRDVFEF